MLAGKSSLRSRGIAALGVPFVIYFAFYLWSLLDPDFSAWTALRLTRYLAWDWAAALVGGYLFGFSSYELGHLMGHLSLSAVFLVPLTVLLCIRYARGEVKRRRFVV